MNCSQVIARLRSHSNPKNVAGMARFGINPDKTFGVSIPVLRKLAKEIGKNHALAAELWKSGIHEAKVLAGMVDDPALVTEKQMDSWVKGFDSWDVCDQVCMNLFARTKFASKKVFEWSKHKEEYVKRAAFALIACIAWQDKQNKCKDYNKFLQIIKRESNDERNFVKKAVNWALRQIGKKDKEHNKMAIATAKQILKLDSRAAKWIANDAIRELESKAAKLS